MYIATRPSRDYHWNCNDFGIRYCHHSFSQTHKHTNLIEQRAERPPVHRLAVALVLQDLGRQVLGGAAEGLRASFHARACDAALGQTEVRQAQVALCVQPVS